MDGPGEPFRIQNADGTFLRLPNLVTQAGYLDRFEVLEVEDPDDVLDCYKRIAAALQKLSQDGAELLVDYTSGTKTMALAVGAVALDLGIELLVTSRQRTRVQSVDYGAYTARLGTSLIRAERVIRWWVPKLMEDYDYAGAVHLVEQTLAGVQSTRHDRQRLEEVLDVAIALDCWDRFDHEQAMRRLRFHRRHPRVRRLLARLESLVAAEESPSYLLVEDLLLNAARRAHQRRYDDAVGRLYRALELMAQTRLASAHGIRTGALEEAQVPEAVREAFLSACLPERPLKIGLKKAYDLLAEYPEDPVGQLYKRISGHLLNQLEVRNNSLLAHGLVPVDRKRYEAFHGVAGRFLEQALAVVSGGGVGLPEQLPTTLEGLVGD